MKKGESVRIEALEALIAEKRKLEGYLAKLDERREGTPEHVYSRLRDEYLTKLTDAQVRAHSEAESISGGLDEDDEAIREIEARLDALKEEKVEGELRAVVGELDAKEWAKRLTALNASISLAEKERDSRVSAVERTRAMLAEAKGSSVTAGPRTPGGATGQDAKDANETKDAKDAKKPGMTGGPSFDELAFLNSVVGRASGSIASVPSSPSPAAQSAPPAPTKPERTSGGSTTEERIPALKRPTPAATSTEKPPSEAHSELKKPAEPAAGPAPVASAPTASAPVPDAAPPKMPPMEPVAESASAESDAFGRPTPRSSQAVKTLKCQECGTFNFPTEWYCERCGGELAAL